MGQTDGERSPLIVVRDGRLVFENIPDYDRSRAKQKLQRPHVALLRILYERHPKAVQAVDLWDEIYAGDKLMGGDVARIHNLVWEIRSHIRQATANEKLDVLEKDPERGGYRLALVPTRAPVANVAAIPCNIPTVQPSLIGREAETNEFLELLRRERILQILGPPGAGKSRLADELGLRARSSFPDGVFKVPLAPVASGETILREVARNMGYNAAPEDLETTLIQHIGERSLLLVLDNFEHLLDQAPVVRRLVAACPCLRVLVTSQRPFPVSGGAVASGEVRRTLLALTLPKTNQAPADSPAVQLFVSRARQASDAFEPDEHDLDLIAEICRQLGGLPLAIQLVAARCRAYGLETILELLRETPFSVADAPGLKGRDSLRGAIAWTANLLGDSERRLLAWLSVFRGGFSFAAAQRMWSEAGESADGLIDVLEQSVDTNLVLRVVGRTDRYAMLEPIRLFFLERLRASKEEAVARTALARWCLPEAKRLDQVLGGEQSLEAVSQLEDERANMRAALSWEHSQGDALYVLELAIALSWFWTLRGDLNEGRENLLMAIESEDVGAPRQRAMALNRLAGMTRMQGDFAQARAWYEQAHLLGQATGDGWNMSFALNGLGRIAAAEGDLGKATEQFELALGIRRDLMGKDPRRSPSVAVTLDNLGDVRLDQEVGAAFVRYREAHRLRHQAKDVPGIAISHLKLGALAVREARYNDARHWIRKALKWFELLGYRDWIATSFEELAKLAAAGGDMPSAAILWGAAQSLDDVLHTVKSPLERQQQDDATEVTRLALGDEYWVHFRNGRAMGLESSLDFARAYAVSPTVSAAGAPRRS
jgi:predicted ATPase